MIKEETNEVIDVPATVENGTVPLSQDRIDTDTIIANIDAQKVIFDKLQEYVKSSLVPKIDYYSIKKNSKPSLGKSGAEKINFIFNLVPKYLILSKVSNSGEIAYELRCDLYNKNSGKFMGSGVGYCSSKEDKMLRSMKSQHIENVESMGNSIFKISKKRSYVDATLSSTMASFIFTQDLEDGYIGDGGSGNGGYDKKPHKKQELNPETFIMLGGKYKDKTLIECPSWYLEGQIKWVTDGKSDPAKFGYDKDEYINMFESALAYRKEKKNEAEDIEKAFDKQEELK